MTEQSSPNTDVERVVRHCTDNLRPSAEWVPFIGYPDGLALAVIDAIWAMIARYPITRGVIRRYSQHRTMEGADPSRDGLSDLLDFYERIGGVDEFIDLIGTRNRVSTQPDAVRKGEAVHQAATVLSELGIETTAQFVAADGTAVGEQARASWLSVPGQGSGISWRYLRMLVGLPDVKPDRMVVRFIASALEVNEQSLDQDEVVRLVQVAAEHFGVDQRSLDHEIWEHQSGSRQGHDPATEQEQLHALASSFVGMAFTALAEDYVIPTSRFHPFIRVGRDYEGGPVMGAPEFVEFQSALEGAFPGRFADPMTRSHPEFPNTYMFGLLEAATARCAQEGGLFEAETPPVERSIHELFEVLRAADYEMSACRAVSHLTTTSDEPVRIGAITVFPEAQSEEGLLERTLRLIPGAPGSFNQEPPRFYDPPHALLVSSARASDADHSETQRALSNAMDRFLLLARLLHAGTHQSCWEVVGPSTLVAGSHPKYRTFGKTTMPDVRFQRVVRLSREDAPAFVALGDFLDAATVRREGMAATSFDVARYRFNRSHEAGDDYERAVDLADDCARGDPHWQ